MTLAEKTACPAPCCLAASRLGRSLDRGIFGLGEFRARGARASALALLRGQLEQGYSCDLAQVLAVREIPIGNDVGLEGRVRCTDTREYDFSRARSGQRFDIRLCQPTLC